MHIFVQPSYITHTVGWLSHWSEFLDDSENAIVRPRQVYLGHMDRNYSPMDVRPGTVNDTIKR